MCCRVVVMFRQNLDLFMLFSYGTYETPQGDPCYQFKICDSKGSMSYHPHPAFPVICHKELKITNLN